MNGWLLVRIAGIVVGIATLLRVATNEGLVTYDQLFLAWMGRLRDVAELGFLTDIIQIGLHRAIDWIRTFGWDVPALQEAWRPVFILISLYLGAFARNGSPSPAWFAFAVVVILALSGGLIAGLAPATGTPAGFLAAVWLFHALRDLQYDFQFGVQLRAVVVSSTISVAALVPDLSWLAAVPIAICVHQAWIATQFGNGWLLSNSVMSGALVAMTFFVPEVPRSYLLIGIVFFVLVEAAWELQQGAVGYWQAWRAEMLDKTFSINAAVGVDVLGVLFGTLFIASLFANPPIW